MAINAKRLDIDNSARISESAHLEAENLYVGSGAVIEEGVYLAGKNIHIGEGTRIRKNTHTVSSGKVFLEEMVIGDFGDVWENCKIYVPKLSIGDYAIIQDGVRLQGHLPMNIGHNFWVGFDAVLNSSGGLTIGDNVGIGGRSEIYSHGYHGELLEGCAINTVAPVNIEEGVWLTGSVYVSPGVNIGKYAVVLFQSNVTKDIPPGVLARGNPAKPVEGFVPYSHPEVSEKVRLMSGFLDGFYRSLSGSGYEQHRIREKPPKEDILVSRDGTYSFRVLLSKDFSHASEAIAHDAKNLDTLLITGEKPDQSELRPNITYFSLSDKRYTKIKTPAEIMFMKHMVPLNARFVPYDSV